MKLTIDRSIWLRGEGPRASRLLRPSDGKMCCVGIFLDACGVPRAQIENIGSVSSKRLFPNLPEPASWLLESDGLSSPAAICLYNTNDHPVSESREKTIASIFGEHEVEVEFID